MGKKELLGFQVSVRESAQGWHELLVDLKARGLIVAPELATGDGALGFWKALDEVSPTAWHQRCTLHKTVNVLDKLPKLVQPAAKSDLREIWNAPDRATAETAIATFAEKYGAKYEKAVTCLIKDQAALERRHPCGRFCIAPLARHDACRNASRGTSLTADLPGRMARGAGIAPASRA